jgi:VanZ family protein
MITWDDTRDAASSALVRQQSQPPAALAQLSLEKIRVLMEAAFKLQHNPKTFRCPLAASHYSNDLC